MMLFRVTTTDSVFRCGNIVKTADDSVDLCDDGLSTISTVVKTLNYCRNGTCH